MHKNPVGKVFTFANGVIYREIINRLQRLIFAYRRDGYGLCMFLSSISGRCFFLR